MPPHNLFLLLSLCFLSSCSFQRLSIQTQYISNENLASYIIGTPDPDLDSPLIGERLFIQWNISKCHFIRQELFLYLKVRLRNHQEEEQIIQIKKSCGYYLYNLINQEYCESGGIHTYYAEIRNKECVIATWKHPLWTPLILFEEQKKRSL